LITSLGYTKHKKTTSIMKIAKNTEPIIAKTT